MSTGTRIERLYLSLGLDLTEFDTDLAGAQAHVRTASSRLNRDLRLQRLRMEIDLAGVDNADNSLTGLGTRLGHLNTQLGTQRNQVTLLNHAYQESVRQLGADAAASRNLQERLTREQLAEARLEQQIRQTNDARRDRVTASVNSGIDNTAMLLAPIVAAGAASLKLAMDAVESENLWRESMGNMVNEGNEWASGLRDNLGLNEVELKKNTGMLNTMFDSMGMGTETSFELSTNISKLAYDMASFYNLPIDQAFEKLRAGMTGESEPLKALGINISENTIKNYAYTHSIAEQGAELTDQQKILASYYAIMEKTKRAQGDMARTLEDPANAIRVLKAQVEELAVSFGQSLIPELKAFVKSAQGIVKFYNDADNGNKAAANTFAKLTIEIGLAAGALSALNMMGLGAANPYLAVALAVGLATNSLSDYLKKKKEIAELEESQRMGNTPSADVAKTRINPNSGYREKEVTFDGLFGQAKRWERYNAEEDAQQDKLDEKMKLRLERRAQLESIIEKSTGNPLTKAAIDEKLKDEFDEEYSTKKWNEKFEREQEQAVKKKELEDQAAAKRIKANRDLSAEISKLEETDYKNSMNIIANKVIDYKKEKLDEVNIAKWAELEKKKAVSEAQKEYLSDLDNLRQAQISNTMSTSQADALITMKKNEVSLQGLETQQSAFNMREQLANSVRLQEKLQVIRAMTEGEEQGSKRRKELLGQEVQASTEYTKSLVNGIKAAMQEIESLQNKTMSAGSQAIGLLDKFEEKKWNFATAAWETSKANNDSFLREIGSIMKESWNSTETHTMAQMGQMLDIKKKLSDSGIDIGVNIDQKDIMSALRKEVSGIPASIEQAKTSMADFYQQIGSLGTNMTQQYFIEWRENLDKLKAEMGGGFNNKSNDTYGVTANSNASDVLAKLAQAVVNIGGVSGNSSVNNNNNNSINNIAVNIPINASINSETDITAMANKVADIIQPPIIKALQGGDENAY